ncbi:TrwN protein [Bartonella gabonensis]|uniref:TrwN protein n=1 Tax=Bartonella gabonensis TaxID=2699889 RepID=UPI00158C6E75|nr:TrwN protein [Bartonella gabonensis]
MIIPDLTMFAAAHIYDTPPPVFSTLIEQEARNNIYTAGNNDKLFRQLSLLREENKEIVTTKQFKQNKHNFDAIFEQINVENVKWFSLFEAFNSCRNLIPVPSTLAYRYEQTTSECIFEKVTLQSMLSFYSTENLSNDTDTQIVPSYIGVKVAERRDKDFQEPVRLKKEELGQATKANSLPLSSEELEDAFAHKESSSRDAFAKEDSSSSTKQLE